MTKVIMAAPHAGEVRYVRDAQAQYLIGSGLATLPISNAPVDQPAHPPSVTYVPINKTDEQQRAAADSIRAHATAAIAHPEVATDTVSPKQA